MEDLGSDMALRRRRKMFQLRDELGLDNDDLTALAEVLLRRDVSSLRGLTDEQVGRMLDALEGAEKIMFLLASKT
jgi:hypothetical protein